VPTRVWGLIILLKGDKTLETITNNARYIVLGFILLIGASKAITIATVLTIIFIGYVLVNKVIEVINDNDDKEDDYL